MDLMGKRRGDGDTVHGSCEHGSEPQGFIFVDQLSNYQFLKTWCAHWCDFKFLVPKYLELYALFIRNQIEK